MPDSTHGNSDPMFFQLVSSFYSAALMQMGKVMNPVTGKVDRQMELAKNTIDLLGMLQTKTIGNLSETERQYLSHTLYELRMNYVDETEHPSTTAESSSTQSTGSTESTPFTP
ncbi:MAG: DUF1844 domain-containing protein [candidate division Zixibacteria bacterium]|nr:DUF1844 domain-containing protein [candidate division Zixibacteria bacterium]